VAVEITPGTATPETQEKESHAMGTIDIGQGGDHVYHPGLFETEEMQRKGLEKWLNSGGRGSEAEAQALAGGRERQVGRDEEDY
jgi:hypothetical protein